MEERGESLIELLVSLTILGVAAIAVVGGLSSSILMSDVHRKQASAGTALRGYAESIEAMIANGGYTNCATKTTYETPTGYTTPPGYTSEVVAGSVQYWTGTGWSASCSADLGLQRLTLRVASTDDRAQERLTLVVRKPCRPADALCG
jgi:Tfp pilus assembly protein PilV